jgi:hypothetical protein
VLALSERLTLVVSCHWSHSRTLTQCSTTYIVSHLCPSVPRPGCSTRRVALLLRMLVSLCCVSTRVKAAIRGFPVAARCLLPRVTITAWRRTRLRGHGDDRQPGPRLVQVMRSIQRGCLERVLVLAEGHSQRLLMSSGASYERWSIPLAHAMDGPESRPALLLIRGACARHDDLPGSLSGTSFAEDSGSAGDCQTFLRPRARGSHAFLLLRWGWRGEVESREKGTGVPHCSSVPILDGLRP